MSQGEGKWKLSAMFWVKCDTETLTFYTLLSYVISFMLKTIFNPLAPNSDQHLISHYTITPESHFKVMRIKEIITN